MYGVFADFYDLFNEDADYDALAGHIADAFRAHGVTDGIVADLGCGTGELTLRLAQMGYDMIGVDASEEMLSILREKEAELDMTGVLLLHQDLRALDLYGTVRSVVSSFDTFNHIGPLAELEKAVCRASLFLEPGGVFAFDMNTPYKHQNVLADNTFTIEADDAACVWRNETDAQGTKISIEITCGGERAEESFFEYSYTRREIEDICRAAKLRVETVCDGETFGPLRAESERYLFVCVKEEEESKICQD